MADSERGDARGQGRSKDEARSRGDDYDDRRRHRHERESGENRSRRYSDRAEGPRHSGRGRDSNHIGDRERGDSRGDRDRDRRGHERRERHRSRSRDRQYDGNRSRSPPSKRRRNSSSRPHSLARKSRGPLPSQVESFRGEPEAGGEKPPEKRKPNYKPTGLLAKEANTVAGTTTVLRYHEPPEGRKPPPKQQWRMYVFKKSEVVDTIYIHTRSCWLAGRDKTVTDLLLEHPSISKQHAVIQFRYQTTTNEFGDKTSKVKPYLIDLGSANGTKLNGNAIDASRYVELVDGDAVVFGESEREYVMMLPPP